MAKTPRAPRARDTASNEQVARLWKASAQDAEASARLEEAIQGLLAAGKLNDSRIDAIRGRIAADEEEIFQKVLLDCATDRTVDGGTETSGLQVRAFGLVLNGDLASIEAALQDPEALQGMSETLKVTEFVQASSRVALLPYALSPMDLAQLGPQGLFDVTEALAKSALGRPDEISAPLAAAVVPDRTLAEPLVVHPEVNVPGVRVLLGVQVVELDALSDEFPDGLHMQLELHDLEAEPDLEDIDDDDLGNLDLREAAGESEPLSLAEAGEEVGEEPEDDGDSEDLEFYNALVHDLEEKELSWNEATSAWLREAGDRFTVQPPVPFSLLRARLVAMMVHQRVKLAVASEDPEAETIDGLEIDFRPQGVRVDIWRNARRVDGLDLRSELVWPYLDDIFDELELSYEVVVRDEMEETAAPEAS